MWISSPSSGPVLARLIYSLLQRRAGRSAVVTTASLHLFCWFFMFCSSAVEKTSDFFSLLSLFFPSVSLFSPSAAAKLLELQGQCQRGVCVNLLLCVRLLGLPSASACLSDSITVSAAHVSVSLGRLTEFPVSEDGCFSRRR